ncbi:hypothetical protein PTSG_06253 [Salpingoeca rosetta]|uniref:alpha-1,2-Mannosidase n=1 Tax=Salpingoeca rosetta (strain ATCC 50818 / BSB-021) TaxID=946362 RepID=F2UCD6_SALR5|nr:uncharacterized protein PTSG_06253 [Salpingoeca rosetta]EGD74243.1 hypothetical protein PTSG_06253 [Salpingoeca rosetta]|eukprot:XP_004993143.1 hypothetical protein PTSG_06253 [Salpingoeca rosetta]
MKGSVNLDIKNSSDSKMAPLLSRTANDDDPLMMMLMTMTMTGAGDSAKAAAGSCGDNGSTTSRRRRRRRKMDWKSVSCLLMALLLLLLSTGQGAVAMSRAQRSALAAQVQEMFQHGYDSYMEHAFPADELMPLSCRGRIRGITPTRGDIDDALGRFSLTLVDSLDTLAVLGNISEFKRAVGLTLQHVSFDRDIVVSTFETNIRMLGGLLGAHAVVLDLRTKHPVHARDPFFAQYDGQLLALAVDLGDRLLAAFNTNTGLPYSRVNLRRGIDDPLVRANDVTCTACAGTIIMEFAALSRFSGDSRFENAARRALEFLWQSRHRKTHLVGTTINITSGAWIRQESTVGAGVDSFFEYLLKAFILLGDQTYLDVFNTHYESIARYLRRGPFLVDVNRHNPTALSRKFMDALQSFFPGLQVLFGDVSDAIEIHRMYYDILLRHKFMPESFTADHEVVWGNSPLRPEFAESTYMLYKATNDPIYLEIGKFIVDNLQAHARVRCGFASVKDVRTLQLEDQMDSFVLAETFKYLYLLFAEEEDIPLKMDDYVFTTEAHLLPLMLASVDNLNLVPFSQHRHQVKTMQNGVCMNDHDELTVFLRHVNIHTGHHQPICRRYHPNEMLIDGRRQQRQRRNRRRPAPVEPENLDLSNQGHLDYLDFLGIIVEPINQAFQFAYHPSRGHDAAAAQSFLQRLMSIMQPAAGEGGDDSGGGGGGTRELISVVAKTDHALVIDTLAGPAIFGPDVKRAGIRMSGAAHAVVPADGCSPLAPEANNGIIGGVAVVRRGGCMFVEKVKHCQDAGALGVVVYNSDEEDISLLTMQGNDVLDKHINIPSAFVNHDIGEKLAEMARARKIHITISH